jgi:hypothetical protein
VEKAGAPRKKRMSAMAFFRKEQENLRGNKAKATL